MRRLAVLSVSLLMAHSSMASQSGNDDGSTLRFSWANGPGILSTLTGTAVMRETEVALTGGGSGFGENIQRTTGLGGRLFGGGSNSSDASGDGGGEDGGGGNGVLSAAPFINIFRDVYVVEQNTIDVSSVGGTGNAVDGAVDVPVENELAAGSIGINVGGGIAPGVSVD